MMRQGKPIEKQASLSEEKGAVVNDAFAVRYQDKKVTNL
jgi:hypothetical protein